MARNHWVAIVELSAMRQLEIKELIRNSYQMVFEKSPKNCRPNWVITKALRVEPTESEFENSRYAATFLSFFYEIASQLGAFEQMR